jgi:rhamnulose-1-phosphate aldolase
MALTEPFPDVDEILAAIGEAGLRVAGLDASEGAAGNISMYIG